MSHDPITRLSAAERNLIHEINRKKDPAWALSNLKTLLQTAVEIELATIPIYLYTYYSLNRTKHTGENMTKSDLFANKAGSLIMSVAVEEMLHMSLSSNILYSLGEMPLLYKKAPNSYPTNLPGHNPKAEKAGPDGSDSALIPLEGLSYNQLWKFLVIEYPEDVEALPETGSENSLGFSILGWDTIGQVYSYIRCIIASDHITDADFQKGSVKSQIQPTNYSPNNTDTVHVSGKYDSWKTPSDKTTTGCPSAAKAAIYPNSDRSHVNQGDAEPINVELITISSRKDAIIAIDTICDQGEGYAQPATPHCDEIETQPTDTPGDSDKTEYSHFYKFLLLQAQFKQYNPNAEGLPQNPPPPRPQTPAVKEADLIADGVLLKYPDNPSTADYPIELQPISNFCNGVFQYMLILTETIYKVEPGNQKLFFNIGMHRSMIWVLDKLIQSMRKIKIDTGPHAGCVLAPTFENIDLGSRAGSFASLKALGDKATAAAEHLIQIGISTQPDPEDNYSSTLKSAASSVQYYVKSAVSAVDGENHPQHLPDVKNYWSE